MMSYFPPPYPDELLYSICARFQERMGLPSHDATLRVLFGKLVTGLAIDLPSHLRALVHNLPPGHLYSLDMLRDQHTLFPFYTAFLPSARLSIVSEEMTGDGSRLHSRLGLCAGRLHALQWLRFCPQCQQEDVALYGEVYWHRVHQIPGVEVCPHHGVWLENTAASARDGHNFITASAVLPATASRPLSSTAVQQQVLLAVARDATWLLTCPHLPLTDTELHQRLLYLLAHKGLVTGKGKVRSALLTQQFTNAYSAQTLHLLQCEMSARRYRPWLVRLGHANSNAQLPIGYLLLLHFLGITASQFFDLQIAPAAPFGAAPWPCLNPVCEAYRQTCITTYTLSHNMAGHLQGTFACPHCGFTYSRTGVDQTPEDRFRITVKLAVGPLWEASLTNWWNDPTYSLRQIAHRLGTTPNVLKRQALRLGLPFPRPGRRTVALPCTPYAPLVRSAGKDPVIREQHRADWLMYCQQCPTLSRTQLAHRFLTTYSWLYRYDTPWLRVHLPPAQRPVRGTSSIDWNQRDEWLVNQIQHAVQALTSASERPVCIKRSVLTRHMGIEKWLYKAISKLPRTKALLAQVLDTRTSFVLRRLQWIKNRYREEGVCPTRYQFMVRAGLNDCLQFPEVVAAFDDALEELQREIPL